MKNIEEIRKEKKSTINFGSVPFEAYVITFQTFLSKHRNFLCCIEPL